MIRSKRYNQFNNKDRLKDADVISRELAFLTGEGTVVSVPPFKHTRLE